MIASHASRPTTIHPLPLSRPAGTRLKDTAMSGGWPAWSPGATRTSGACDRPCAAVDSSTTQRCPRSARSRDGREETQRLHLNPKSGLLRASSSKNAKLFLTLGVCYRRGADGPLGRRSGFRYGRCRLLWLLRAVPVSVARQPLHLLAGQCHARCPARGVPSRGPGVFRAGLLRLVGGLGDRCRWRPATLRFREQGRCSGDFPVVPRLARRHPGRGSRNTYRKAGVRGTATSTSTKAGTSRLP
jgi:hypothetical protein